MYDDAYKWLHSEMAGPVMSRQAGALKVPGVEAVAVPDLESAKPLEVGSKEGSRASGRLGVESRHVGAPAGAPQPVRDEPPDRGPGVVVASC